VCHLDDIVQVFLTLLCCLILEVLPFHDDLSAPIAPLQEPWISLNLVLEFRPPRLEGL
jgi:hypothetical protein